MSKAEEILSKYPSVKLGLDDHYGKQTVLNMINEALKQPNQILIKQIEKWEDSSNINADVFKKTGMNTSSISAAGMAQAYWNVLQFIDVNK